MVCMIRKPLSPPMPLKMAEEIIKDNGEMPKEFHNFRFRRSSKNQSNEMDFDQLIKRIEIVKNDTFYFNITSASILKPMVGVTAAALVTECQLARHKKHIIESRKDQNNKIEKEKKLMELTVVVESCYEAEKFKWSSMDQGNK